MLWVKNLRLLYTVLLRGDKGSAETMGQVQVVWTRGSSGASTNLGLHEARCPWMYKCSSCLAGLCCHAFFGSLFGLSPAGLGEAPAAAQDCTGMSVLLPMLLLHISFLSGSGWWEEMLSFVSAPIRNVFSFGMRKLICIRAQSSTELAKLFT